MATPFRNKPKTYFRILIFTFGVTFRRSDGPTTRVVIGSSTAGVVQSKLSRIDGPVTGDVIISPTAGVFYYILAGFLE